MTYGNTDILDRFGNEDKNFYDLIIDTGLESDINIGLDEEFEDMYDDFDYIV